MGLKTKIISANDYAKGISAKTRLFLLISALVALAFFVIGILIGHFGIEKTSSAADKEDSDGGSLTDECKQDQFTKEHKAYSER